MRDPSEVLGVERGASVREIRVAYKRLVKKHHPDRFANASAEARVAAHERMAEINAAYRMLNDPQELDRFERIARDREARSDGQGVGFRVRKIEKDERDPLWAEPDPDFDYRRRAASEFNVGKRKPGNPWTAGGTKPWWKRGR